MNKWLWLLLSLMIAPAYAFADLTGVWTCNDGGTYYVRQIGNEVHWYGENDATHPRWSNVFHGTLSSRGNTLIGNWADVPKGRTSGMGEMRLRIKAGGNVMESYRKTGGFGGSQWLRKGYTPQASARPAPVHAEQPRVRARQPHHASPPAATRPQTYSTGALDIKQTYSADLDHGKIATGRTSDDIWFEAVNAREKYLVPLGHASFSVGDRSNRGYDGCARARYSRQRVRLELLPAGSYVCVRTSEGRISQFRVNRISGGRIQTISIGYTTWKH